MNKDNLQELLVEGLKDLYDAEKQITKALPKMVSEAKAADLRQAFEDHLTQTRAQVRRLESVFDELKVTDRKKECKGMQAIIQEGEEMAKQVTDATAKDFSLISSAQHVEHYEMAGYGTAITYAHQLEHHNVADKLQQSLNEEKQTDLFLSQIAESKMNGKNR